MIPESITLHSAKEIRNQQAGDWRFSNPMIGSHLYATSIPLKDPRHRFLIQLHEMVEAVLCGDQGITDGEVTAFDAKFEVERAAGQHGETDEDGDDPRAPYHHPHRTATLVEMIVADALGVNWKEYEQAIADYFHA